MTIPQGTTHRLFGRPLAFVQFYKLEDGKWYYWSDMDDQWCQNLNTYDWLDDNLIPVNL